jgi:DNA invertase Pin-like site-specific DNA recombinase
LGARARQLGWPHEARDIMDEALGLTAASAAHRTGLHPLVAPVTLAQVGLMLSSAVTRLSRHCSDWYPLLDLCGYTGGVMGDGDGREDPATVNGRLLLGLQGTRSAWERHTLTARLTAGLLPQARRGALALTLPTGLIRTSQGTGHKLPNQAAQARLSLVCETFWQGRSARQVVAVFNPQALVLPRRDRFGALVWKAPRGAAGLAMRTPPASAGAFTDGRTRTRRRETRQGRPALTRLPQEQGRVCSPDVSPPSSRGETYRQRQTRRTEHHAE